MISRCKQNDLTLFLFISKDSSEYINLKKNMSNEVKKQNAGQELSLDDLIVA